MERVSEFMGEQGGARDTYVRVLGDERLDDIDVAAPHAAHKGRRRTIHT